MAVRLCIGDAILLHIDHDRKAIGIIKYIGGVHNGDMMSEYLGVELMDPISNGHNGSIGGYY